MTDVTDVTGVIRLALLPYSHQVLLALQGLLHVRPVQVAQGAATLEGEGASVDEVGQRQQHRRQPDGHDEGQHHPTRHPRPQRVDDGDVPAKCGDDQLSQLVTTPAPHTVDKCFQTILSA